MTQRNSLIHRLLDFNLLNKWGHILLNCISSLIGKEACSMNRSNMFHIILVFIVQTVAFSEPILVERVCQDFIQISTPLSASCETSANLRKTSGIVSNHAWFTTGLHTWPAAMLIPESVYVARKYHLKMFTVPATGLQTCLAS